MTLNVHQLLTSLYAGVISKDEFIENYFSNTAPSDNYVIAILNKGIKEKDPFTVEEAIALITTGYFSNSKFISELCELLQMTWHTKHEDIALLLNEIKDQTTVDCLYRAVELDLEYLSYDDTYQFARKCIKALSAIDSHEARERLMSLHNSSRAKKISEYARKELVYKGLL